jgi:two-component system, OmpR family, response regulator
VRILVVEDDSKVASFVARALTEEGHQCDVAADGLEGERQGRLARYDVIVLDWMLPGMDGLSVCRSLRRAGVRTPVMMLTARDEVGERVLGLDAGADDYVVKPFALEEFLARVRALGRRASEGAGMLVVEGLSLDLTRRTFTVEGGAPVELTGREFGLLEYLVRNAGRPVARTELLARVWGTAFDPGTNVIDVYVRHLREKLGEQGKRITTLRGVGYAFDA